jgi:D-alanyl-lipoteichoic acid acyltransferase DltB (MBOAT superfamily)
MVFTSVQFIIFFAVVFALVQITPHKYKWFTLLLSSYYFYAHYKLEYLPLLVVPTLLVFLISIKISKTTKKNVRKRWLLFGLFITLSVLAFFKYVNFIGGSIFSIVKIFNKGVYFTPIELIWPIGISFYIFKLISYLIDVYKENTEVELHLGYFALYVASFPQLLAGPIDRAKNFIPELKKRVYFDLDRIIEGIKLILLGIFKKMVISDRLAIYVNEVFSKPSDFHGINVLLAAYFFAFQIYCDFSGYSDMAIGLSKMLGYESMDNFKFPYFSKNLTQFWNRWHISLSTWLRDYLFLPIAYSVMNMIKGNRFMKIKVETWGYVIGMFITMLLGGLWHGATWTMVIWGSIHGLFLSIGYLTKKLRKKTYKKLGINKFKRIKIFFGTLFTFNLVTFAWIFFRSESFAKAINFIGHIDLKTSIKGNGYMLFNLIMVISFIIFELIYKKIEEEQIKVPTIIKLAGYAFFICVIIVLSIDSSNEFIYFQF